MTADFFNSIQQFIDTAPTRIIVSGKSIFDKIDDETEAYNLSYSGDNIVFETKIKSSNRSQHYDVEITYTSELGKVDGKCTCPYSASSNKTCKHLVAVALHLTQVAKTQNILAKTGYTPPAIAKEISEPLLFTLSRIDYRGLMSLASIPTMNEARNFFSWAATKVEVTNEGKTWVSRFRDKHRATIEWKEASLFEINCTCKRLQNARLCSHAVAIFMYVSEVHSNFYFKQFEDTSDQKAILLKQYGITPEHPLAADFVFGYDYNANFIVQKAPAQLLLPSENINWEKMKERIQPKKTIIINIDEKKSVSKDYQAGILFNFGKGSGILEGFDLQLLMVMEKKNGNSHTFEKLTLKENAHLSFLTGMPKEMKEILKGLIADNIQKYLQQEGQAYVPNLSTPNFLRETQQSLLQKYYYHLLEELRPFMSSFKQVFYLSENQKFVTANIKGAAFNVFEPQFTFSLQCDNKFISLYANIAINNATFPLTHFAIMYFFLFDKNEFFLVAEQDLPTLNLFQKGYITTPKSNQAAFIQNIAIPLSSRYPVDFGKMFHQNETEIGIQPKPAVYFSELNENFLLLKVKWFYEGHCVEDWDEGITVLETVDGTIKVNRNKEAEQKHIEEVRALHQKFEYQDKGFFYVNFLEAMRNNWFITANQQLADLGFAIYGLKELEKLKYNTNSPFINIETSSGIDWFDLKIEVRYGDIIVPLAELRKAFKNNQDYILLSDGTMGMLPKEWIEKYASILKLGQIKEGVLKISKFNWTLLDNLYEQIDNTAVLQELEEKKQRLKDIDTTTIYKLSKNIKAKLRDYQIAGFQWLCLLGDLGWGGCLADDMGLGKTLQTICFLQHRLDSDTKRTHLIVCPTSLIYNWETELKKFAPEIKYYIHYGSDRNFDIDQIMSHQVVITSYGLMRSDIEKLSGLQFDYLVLDESQAIKNPVSQSAKAVQLLKAQNRLALSGTPIQNNTVDLYAQLNFLNPGMLLSLEFFKEEFATPIDKAGDKEKSAQLRKLIYPFLLRRTKEQVAKDLPDKTESILWCEMEPPQRKTYNAFKDHYRESLLGRIATDGMGKSSIYILEGLTKLRQICNSPAILNEKEKFPNESIKLAELTREIEENTGNHKALVFSQFTSMLALIEEQLKKDGVKYMYLDGSTPAAKRKAAVEKFQADDAVRVFLISLKAGGVGLNLTSADYVYIIDPWWNPAAESQAIDRTHRIGQSKKVFAYKMICKDTVEEKILQLQERKKALAADLIADEGSFVKKLTKEDVAFLFA